MKISSRFKFVSQPNEEVNSGVDKVVRIGFTPLAERVKTIIRQADESFALKATDFDDLTQVDPNSDELMENVITSNEFDKFQYLEMLNDINQDIQRRNEILEAREKEKQAEYEAWLLKQSELESNKTTAEPDSKMTEIEPDSED